MGGPFVTMTLFKEAWAAGAIPIASHIFDPGGGVVVPKLSDSGPFPPEIMDLNTYEYYLVVNTGVAAPPAPIIHSLLGCRAEFSVPDDHMMPE
jgi:hypothetical protein